MWQDPGQKSRLENNVMEILATLQSYPGKGNDPSTPQLCILGSEDIVLQKEMIFPKLREELSIGRALWLPVWGDHKYPGVSAVVHKTGMQ